ncbi:hypothetical protein DYB25_006582 [Aphanomyces astaci]|uniref:Uncharacterized protein n=1 Tax=Aphanomyces astaci TaxID=112090 RepID=A0A397BQA8_APHAT|nr:hypothetical protein DYB25_006582 [Aphanomyces astaci]
MDGVANIFAAARANDLSAVQHMLEELAGNDSGDDNAVAFNVNRLVDSTTHNTLMHIACSNGNLAACKFLFMHGMYLNEPNNRGHTPLFYAADCGNLPLVKWMVSNGADIDTDYSGKATTSRGDNIGGKREDNDRRYDLAFTPLQVACVKGHQDIVDFLVECNADLGGSAVHGVTALHFACHQNQKGIAKVLLDAGADMHAPDGGGASPMDLASGPTLAFLTAYDAHDGDDNDDNMDGPRASLFGTPSKSRSTATTKPPPPASSSSAVDGPDVARLLPDCIGKAFGADVARALASHEWKARQLAVTDVGLIMAQQSNAAKHFDAACHVLLVATRDSVGQVFAAAMPLVKAAFNAVLTMSTFHTPGYHASHPMIGEVLDALLGRAAGTHERDASDAVTSLLFLACKSAHATQHMVQTMQTQLAAAATTGGGWRQHLVNLRLVTAIASQYRFSAESGLSFDQAMAMSATALDHSSVKVRSAAVDLLVQAVVVTTEQAGLSGMADAVVVGQVIDYTDSVLHQYLGNTVKSSVVATIHKGLKAALGNSKRLSRGATTTTPGKPPPSSSPSELLLPKQNPTFKSADECSDADLPYAEPVQGAAADGISTCFGDKVARCLFSNAWAPRVEGLSHLQKLLQAKRCDIVPATVAAIDAVLQAALSDRVNAVVSG